MSLSDCVKCWDTPCECGWDLRYCSIQRLEEKYEMIGKAIAFKKANPNAKFSKFMDKEDTKDDEKFMEFIRR